MKEATYYMEQAMNDSTCPVCCGSGERDDEAMCECCLGTGKVSWDEIDAMNEAWGDPAEVCSEEAPW